MPPHTLSTGPIARDGFTLIELSIVLVIIGLIVGGVLVGQDLINAATVRAEVTQLERYNTAANTFLSKYGGLPGDLLNCANYFNNGTCGGNQKNVAGWGNGDGLIESLDGSGHTCNAANSDNYNCMQGEVAVFWWELNQAALIPDATTGCHNGSFSCVSTISSAIIPNGKISGSTVSVQVGADGHNYWVLGYQNASLLLGVPFYNGPGLTVLQAYQIDTKIDDGMPGTGTVVSISGGEPNVLGDAIALGTGSSVGQSGTTPVTNNCGSEGNGNPVTSTTTYNIAVAPNNINCQLSVRANF